MKYAKISELAMGFSYFNSSMQQRDAPCQRTGYQCKFPMQKYIKSVCKTNFNMYNF